MKHFWVIFKLLLLIVFALRLLKSNRKIAKFEHDPQRGLFNLFQENVFSEKIHFTFENDTSELQLKEIFRKNIRPKEEIWKQNNFPYDDFFATLSLEERMIYVSYLSNKSFQKGSIFNFLWYKSEWIIAFGQILKTIQIKTFYTHYQQVILETTGFDLDTISSASVDSFQLDLHPDGSQVFESVTQFDKHFDRNIFLQKIIDFSLKNTP
ncbi:hypothetical protein EMA8858_02515 [Emticicia aquatica]|jgi:hypothetical protein|uniref:Uncharacterized protein n=1 Tax=Emticicia aquatica TaxID=1681835 RepID=A0ABN8EX72_9BACT|nr:hypothetical protein [Emticicia aquatica]CAH0996383.1 hypothetical protein EMA8858_02515 [Emticicia aquatica]